MKGLLSKKTDSLKKKEHVVRREPGSAIEGDKLLFQCRKPPEHSKARCSDAHHYFLGHLSMNAYAVVDRTFRTIKP